MRNLILSILLGVAQATTISTKSEVSTIPVERLKGLADGTCIRFNGRHVPKHRWEVDKSYEHLPWVMIEQDNTAARIAQPSSFCSENHVELSNCQFYWDRTVDFDKDSWFNINGDFDVIKCPNELKGKNLLKKLKE